MRKEYGRTSLFANGESVRASSFHYDMNGFEPNCDVLFKCRQFGIIFTLFRMSIVVHGVSA